MGATESSPSAGRDAGRASPLAPSRRFTPVEAAPDGDWCDDPGDFRLVVEVPGVLDADQCDLLLSYIAEFGQTAGRVGTEDGRTELDPDFRQVRDTRIPRTPETAWVYEAVGSAIDQCNREFFGFVLRDFSQDLLIADYRDGDFFEWHIDLGAGVAYRKLAASVMLSSPEDYEGGALAFPGTDFDQVPRGSAVVFPSFLLHGVRPVKRGRRRALVAWVGGPRFR